MSLVYRNRLYQFISCMSYCLGMLTRPEIKGPLEAKTEAKEHETKAEVEIQPSTPTKALPSRQRPSPMSERIWITYIWAYI